MGDVAEDLWKHPRFRWQEGMRDLRGRRVVDLDLWDGASPPDLADYATAGCLFSMLDEHKRFTDVVKQGDEWIVAVELPEDGLQGWAGDTLGEAAAHALINLWAAEGDEGGAPDLASA